MFRTMVIKKIEIKDFGKFSDYVIQLAPDIQIIYGCNESGKSTLMEFLKFMFYSRRKGVLTSAEDKILRKKYMPWNGQKMKGAIEIEYKGFDYKIQKEIHGAGDVAPPYKEQGRGHRYAVPSGAHCRRASCPGPLRL